MSLLPLEWSVGHLSFLRTLQFDFLKLLRRAGQRPQVSRKYTKCSVLGLPHYKCQRTLWLYSRIAVP